MVYSPHHSQVRYLTNANGEVTDVLIPLELWQQAIGALREAESGLAWVDECEPNAQILSDLHLALKEASTGETLPVSQLWDDLDS